MKITRQLSYQASTSTLNAQVFPLRSRSWATLTGLSMALSLLSGCEGGAEALQSDLLAESSAQGTAQAQSADRDLMPEGLRPGSRPGQGTQSLGGCDPRFPTCTKYGTGEENIYPPDLFYSAFAQEHILTFLKPTSTGFSVMVNRISASGVALDGTGLAIGSLPLGSTGGKSASTEAQRLMPVVSASADGFVVVFNTQGKADLDLVSALIPYEGSLSRVSTRALAGGAGAQHSASIAATSRGFLVSFVDDKSGSAQLYTTMLDSRGYPISESSQPITVGEGTVANPVLVAGEKGVLSVSELTNREGLTQVKGVLLSEAGRAEGAPFGMGESSDAQAHPSAVAVTGGFMVAYERTGNGQDIEASLLNDEGGTQWSQTVSAANGDQTMPRVSFDGSAVLVGFGNGSREGTFLDSALLDLSGRTLSVAALAPSIVEGSGPAIASNGEDFLVIYKVSLPTEVALMGVSY